MQVILITILFYVVFLVFIIGIILFVARYKKSKLQFEIDKQVMHEKHLRELVQAQLESQQLTMQDIGQEIHDSVGQKLTLASLYTQQLSFTNRIPEATEQLITIGNIINESLAELRSLSKSLTGQQLQQANLVQVLQMECDRINESGVCKARVKSNKPVIIVGQPALNMLQRMMQEFMQNSLKHSNCNTIVIELKQEDATLIITATDDGTGFDLTAAKLAGKGIGISNMERRAGIIGAIFEISSSMGKGTKIRISLPY